MLVRDPKKRITTEQLLSHPYFEGVDPEEFQRRPPFRTSFFFFALPCLSLTFNFA